MFSTLPGRYPILIRSSLSSAWLLLSLCGVSAVLSSPRALVVELGTLITYGWGAVLAVAALIAAIGVVANRYRWEWSAAWFATSGLSAYALTMWWLVFTGGTAMVTHAAVVSGATMFTVTRALFCAAHAAKLRAIHSGETGPTHVAG